MFTPKQSHHKSTAIIIVGGLVALGALWVVGSSNCGSSLDFNLLPSPNVQVKKEACLPVK
ncbi:hypothetical protein [Nostoc sp. UHCC 0251]|jgi:hypothetical protein|uniref:hypothetical protein n=1 Tax=Nostoc sp. UHCC 0251 TaxID=3110240 RepID=UPI002B202AEB|nr:hypothetical protein [Nostoc sp. UHCC 0251]MEA5625838.1 hypothetical protein [Nostoc sp. UHCC 0251]